ncbi:MAG: GSCFA domain-containing protein [Muribaculaceae bacterium]|nr:GSCFA domain-containing protein [Muribaculaceae bacterium]MDE6461613.1 GSCFA domain-containing protein [Muribaculaceae bacterium]
MNFRTALQVPTGTEITHRDRLLMLGSCFSTEVGARLLRDGFNTTVNPTGTLYNPMSVAKTIGLLESCTPILPGHLFENQGLWRSFDHHSSLSDPDRDKALEKINSAITAGHKALQEATHVFVTFGTAWVFELPEGGIVCNCHKLPPRNFIRRRVTVNEIVGTWTPILRRHPDKHFTFTVSPIRHTADGLHGNQLSKSTLLLAVDELCAGGAAEYFPAYEALIDDLRDYRFYAADMKHPSDVAVDYVYSLFASARFSQSTMTRAAEAARASRRAAHRPLH